MPGEWSSVDKEQLQKVSVKVSLVNYDFTTGVYSSAYQFLKRPFDWQVPFYDVNQCFNLEFFHF